MTHLLCVGLGYSAKRVAAKLSALGWCVTGSSRSVTGSADISSRGYAAVPFEGTAESGTLRSALTDTTHLLVSAAPDAEGDPLLRWHAEDITTAPRLQWIGYLSTIGVYGDQQGAWVDEATPPAPTSQRGHWRVEAEQAWLGLPFARPVTVQVFRLAGIYGPGQNLIEALRRGEAKRIVKPGQVFNRIHVDDIAGAVLAGIAHLEATGIFNVADDLPAAPDDVIVHAAKLAGIAPPPAIPFETAELSAMARSFYGAVKRVSNARAKRELGWRPLFPTYREGLAALAKI